MVNSAIQAGDFANFPFVDWQETVSRTPVTKTTDFYGDEKLTDGAPADIQAIVHEVIRGSRKWEKLGYVQEFDAVIYVLPAQTLNLNDKITVSGRTYQCLQPITRSPGGVSMYTVAGMFLADDS